RLGAGLAQRHQSRGRDAEEVIAIYPRPPGRGLGDDRDQLRQLFRKALDVFDRVLHLRPVAMAVQEPVGLVDLVGQPPAAHQPQVAHDLLGIGRTLERQMELQRIERKPDARRIAIDGMDFGPQRLDGATPVGGGVTGQVLVQGHNWIILFRRGSTGRQEPRSTGGQEPRSTCGAKDQKYWWTRAVKYLLAVMYFLALVHPYFSVLIPVLNELTPISRH